MYFLWRPEYNHLYGHMPKSWYLDYKMRSDQMPSEDVQNMWDIYDSLELGGIWLRQHEVLEGLVNSLPSKYEKEKALLRYAWQHSSDGKFDFAHASIYLQEMYKECQVSNALKNNIRYTTALSIVPSLRNTKEVKLSNNKTFWLRKVIDRVLENEKLHLALKQDKVVSGRFKDKPF